jgi:hypothetical protein
MEPLTGAKVIAQALHDLGVSVVHTLVGVPVADIAEEAIDLGIRVIGYRNEQACSYAASVYGYLTGRPGVCLLTGGPGILHGMAGVRILLLITEIPQPGDRQAVCSALSLYSCSEFVLGIKLKTCR